MQYTFHSILTRISEDVTYDLTSFVLFYSICKTTNIVLHYTFPNSKQLLFKSMSFVLKVISYDINERCLDTKVNNFPSAVNESLYSFIQIGLLQAISSVTDCDVKHF